MSADPLSWADTVDPRFWKDAIGEGSHIILSNWGPDDQDFIGEFGEHGWLSWNVSRLWADACVGQHGGIHQIPTDILFDSCCNVEIDADHVERVRATIRKGEAEPLLMLTLTGISYMIDGHHRVHAAKREGIAHLPAFIVGLERPFDALNSRYRIFKHCFPTEAALKAFKNARRAAAAAKQP